MQADQQQQQLSEASSSSSEVNHNNNLIATTTTTNIDPSSSNVGVDMTMISVPIDEEEQHQSSFPPPPKQYYRNFDAENTRPPPRPLPSNTPIQTFGNIVQLGHTIKRPKDDHIRELFHIDDENVVGNVVSELKRLNRSLCFNFLELLNILLSEKPNEMLSEDINTTLLDAETFLEQQKAQQSSSSLDVSGKVLATTTTQQTSDVQPLEQRPASLLKVQQIQLLLLNMSYLLNSYRPVQARQQAITIMQHASERRMEASSSLHDTLALCKSMLLKTRDVLTDESSPPTPSSKHPFENNKRSRDNREEFVPGAKKLKRESRFFC